MRKSPATQLRPLLQITRKLHRKERERKQQSPKSEVTVAKIEGMLLRNDCLSRLTLAPNGSKMKTHFRILSQSHFAIHARHSINTKILTSIFCLFVLRKRRMWYPPRDTIFQRIKAFDQHHFIWSRCAYLTYHICLGQETTSRRRNLH